MTKITHETKIEDNGDVTGRIKLNGKSIKYKISADAITHAANEHGIDVLAEVTQAIEAEFGREAE